MSADLFAEFGYGASTDQPSRTSRQHAIPSQAGSQLISGLNAFEDFTPFQSSSHLNEPNRLSGPSRTINSQSSHFNDFGDFGDFEQPQSGNGNDVLFDAVLERLSDDGSDDWGEFESASAEAPGGPSLKAPIGISRAVDNSSPKVLRSSAPPRGVSGNQDLLDSLEFFSIKTQPTANHNSHERSNIDDKSVEEKNRLQATSPKAPVQDEFFEEWGDFTDGPIETSRTSSSNNNANGRRASKRIGDLAQTTKATAITEGRMPPTPTSMGKTLTVDDVRPTNIPPPSILLELFPQLFERLRQEGAEAKKKVQNKDDLEAVALSIFCTIKAAARVVAGRALRWKRDAILSQSMRIGPARSGKAGGMKLSTVNKNEGIKEQQEAVDVINMWRDRAALFNSVIQAAGRRPVQVILEDSRVVTTPASQGAIKASHACALCGLKRDERLPRVDEKVEDSFGEWWAEHWGHTECRRFWEDNKSLLGQR
ncbi:hypothetical protein BJX99DRAFT_183889 [Aspergillus californicus]